LKIEKEIREDRQAKLSVEYTPEEFEGFKRRAARKISKNAKIPGFRPGKAPYQVIVNHFGEEPILNEAIDLLLDDDYAELLKKAEIEPSGTGSVENIESIDPPKLTFMIPLEPEIDLGNYREIRKDYAPEDFDINKVDDYIGRMLKNAATIVPADHPAQKGDLVYYNLSGEFLNPGEDEDAMITDKTPQQALIPLEGEELENEWPYLGFAKQLLGVEAGAIREFQYTYPDDYEDEDYRGKTAIFNLEVQSVKSLELPALDEDFIQSLGDFDSLEDLQEKLEAQLREDQQNDYDQTYFDELLNEIIEQSKLNYPPQMLAHEENHILEDFKSRIEKDNITFDKFLELRNTDLDTFVEDVIRPTAKKRLERSLIMDALIDSESLKLNQEMLKEQINRMMGEIIYSGNLEELQKQMGKNEFSRAISREGVERTLNTQIKNRLKLIATGQPIPEEETELSEEEQLSDEEKKDETEVEAITDNVLLEEESVEVIDEDFVEEIDNIEKQIVTKEISEDIQMEELED